MVVVFTPENINVESDTGCYGKLVEDMGNHLRREVPDFFALET